MRILSSTIAALALGFLMAAGAASAEPWPQWRGPQGNGISAEKNLPVSWSATENIAWKADLPGRSASSPIVWGDRVFVTAQIGQGPSEEMAAGAPDSNAQVAASGAKYDIHFEVFCFSAKDGKLLWKNRVEPGEITTVHKKHDLGSPSCATDGERVYAWFGSGPIVCLDMEGKVLWERDLSKEFGPFVIKWGHGSSPILHGDDLILLCDHTKSPFILAVDKKTGKDRWKSDKGLTGRSYSTPYIIETAGRKEMLVNEAFQILGFDPANGDLLWSAKGLDRVMSASPVFEDGVIYTSGGWRNAPFMALKPGGKGDVTETSVLWHKKNGAPYTPSMLVLDGLLYMADNSVALCVDAKNGEQVWKDRINGPFSASPVAADGKIYFVSEGGETSVLAPGREFKVLSRNLLEERTLASPAISGGRIFIRTDRHLFAIGAKN